MLKALEDSIKAYGVGLEALGAIGGPDRVNQLIEKSTEQFDMIGRYLINTRQVLQDLWERNKGAVIRCLLPLLQSGEGWEISAVADWLRDKAEQIPPDSYNAVIQALQPKKDEPPETATKKQAALIQVRQDQRKILQKPLFDVLDREADVDSQSESVQKLLQIKSREVTRDLVSRWFQWLASGDKPLLAETTTEYLRMSTEAVLPLVDHFSKKLELDDRLKRAIVQQEISPTHFELIGAVYPKLADRERESPLVEEYFQSQAQNLLGSLENRSAAFNNLKSEATEMRWNWTKIVEKTVEQLFREELSEREERGTPADC